VSGRERLPEFIEPMLLRATDTVPTRAEWSLEVKWDGMRAQLACDGRKVALRSRTGRQCVEQFPELRAIADALPHLNGPAWTTPRWFSVDEDLTTTTRGLHLEGIVAKRLDAPYQAGRRSGG
jgi:ATP-dependent DNA ligase